MQMNLPLKELWCGKLEGREAYFTTPTLDKGVFDTFLTPDNVNLSRLSNSNNHFILGPRGVGKTSLLRYFSQSKEESGCSVYFVLFKTHFTEPLKVDLSKNVWFDRVASDKFEISQDYKDSWTWFIIRKLSEILINDESIPPSSPLSKLMGIGSDWFSTVLGFFPTIRGGNIQISSPTTPIGQISADLGFERKSSPISIRDVNQKAMSLLRGITLNRKIYLLIDELEVFFQNQQQYKRDLWMVRDIVFAVKELNYFFRENNIEIHIVCAVRTEVLYALSGADGQEVERVVEDASEKLSWNFGTKNLHHPLLNIIRKYLKYSESRCGKAPHSEENDILLRYFPSIVSNVKLETFLLDNSFYKPRDIVARLNAAREGFPNDTIFSQNVLERSLATYSKSLWREVTYELSANFVKAEIGVIESLFRAKHAMFSYTEFQKRISDFAEYSSSCRDLAKRLPTEEIVRDLFRLGVIGNEWTERGAGRIHRWSFRGDTELVFERQIVLNRSLWSHFAARRS